MLYEHGGYFFQNDRMNDFSANINPLGMPEGVKNALIHSIHDFEKYPDPNCTKLVKKLSDKIGIAPEYIVCGNGAADLLYRMIHTFKPKISVICTPSFSEYQKALAEIDSAVIPYALHEENDFILDDGLLKILDHPVDMLILTTPNNPTGKLISIELLENICKKCLENHIIFLCDECFMEFVNRSENFTAKNFLNENVVILKAFTKIFAMAGLRLGYAVFGSLEKAERVRKTGQFWSVSVPAQIAGIAALEEDRFLKNTVQMTAKEREFLQNELRKTHLKIFSSEANFILLKCGLPLDEMLFHQNILIRNCGNFKGLNENFFRIAVKKHKENSELILACKRILNG